MASGDALSVKMFNRDGAAVLAPSGEIGYQEAPAFKNHIKQAYETKPTKMVVDLTGVSYMGTPGVATLVEALQVSRKTRTPLILCSLNERVRAIFDIARLTTVFTITDTLDEAMEQ